MKKSSNDKTTSSSRNPGTSLMRALEQRIMFDAAVAATVADNVNADAQASAPAAESVTPDHHELLAAAAAISEPQNQRQEIIFVDTSVTNYQSLVDGINPAAEVVLINAGEDGLQVIADTLEGRTDIDAIHILSHGDTGKIQLGGEWIDSADVTANADLLASIGVSLSENGDILLYGCHVGTNGAGVDFIQSLASATGADIAASNDATGAISQGGDWVLEATQGSIETIPLNLSDYSDLLAAFSDDFSSTTGSGVTSFTRTLGGISYTFTFTSDGDGGDFAWENTNGFGGSSSVNMLSGGGTGAVERVTIARTDGADFTFDSIFIDNASGGTTNVRGYLDTVAVGTNQTMTAGNSGTLTFSSLRVDQVQITSTDFFGTNFDNFAGDTNPPNSVPTTSNLNGDSVAWAGVGSYVSLDASSNANLADAELDALNTGNGNWQDATLTVQRSGTAITSDTFGFNTSGALFTVTGTTSGNLQSGGQTFATYTNSNGVLAITFTSSGTTATSALVDNVAQRITYRSDTPAGDATVSFTVTDGDGGTATAANVTVTSDTIYVTNTTDTSTINISNGVSFSEAVAIAAADATGSQTIVFSSSMASTALTISSVSLSESLTIDMDSASGMSLTSGTITLGAGTTQTFTNGTGDTATISGVIAGSGAFTKAGAGGLTLSATNTYSGATTISAGTLTVSGGDAISTNSSVSVASGATLALSNNETIGNLSGAGSVTLGSNTLTSSITADTTFSGGISGTGGLQVTQSGAATFALTLSGTNTYTGNTTAINFGSLRLNGDASVSNSSYLRANGNSVITLLSNQTVGSLGSNSANATINLGSFALSAGGDNTSTTVSGVISGTGGSLVKEGSGTLTLAGSNTYTSTTTVSGGTLSIASDSNLGGGSVTLAGGTTLDVTGATTIDNAIALSGSATISASAAATLSGAISGANDLTVSASGTTLTLSGTNSYSGTTVSAGTLSIASDANLGSGTVTLASGTTLAITGATTIDNAISLSGNATISNSASATLSGTISGANTLTKAGSSTLTLSGTNSYSNTSISAGTLSVASDSNLGSGSVSLATGTTLAVTGATTIDNNIAITGTGTVDNSAAVTLSGVISGSNLTKAGSSTLTLSGTNTYTGSTSVSAGTLSVASDANLGSSTINLANGTTLSITGATTIDNALALTGVATINAAAAATLSNTVSGTGGLSKTGAGTLTLSGSNNYSGTTTLSAGTLSVASDGNLGSSTVTLAAGTTLQVTGATTIDNAFTLSGATTIQADAAVTVSGAISGANTLTKAGTSTLTLSGTNSYGATTVSAGTLSVASDSNLGSGTVTLDSGALQITGTTTIDNALTIASDSTVQVDAAATLSGQISGSSRLSKTGTADLTLANSNNINMSGEIAVFQGALVAASGNYLTPTVVLIGGDLTFTGATTYSGVVAVQADATLTTNANVTFSNFIEIDNASNTLTKSGAGVLTLTSAGNSQFMVGKLAINAGTVSVANDGNLSDGSVTINGGTLAITSGSTFDNSFIIGASGGTINVASSTATLSGVVSGSGALTKTGAGTLGLSNTNTYTGATNLNAGTLSVGSDANLGADTINMANGTSLSITGSTTIDNALALTGVATINASAAATLSGTISSTGGLTKTGTSTLTLSGTNTYSGATTVSAGTLLISGSTDSATTVANGGTLAGGGTIDGAVTVQSGGTLSPGSSPGTLTINGNLTMNSGSTLAVEINGTTAGTDYDQIIVTGAVDVSSATLSVTHGYSPGQGDTYTIIDNDGVDAITGTFSGLSEGGTLTASGNSTVLTASYAAGTGNDFTLTAPINAAPTVGNLNGDNPTFTQGSGAILLDASTDATVTDGDSVDFDGGNVTVSIVTNGVAGEDVLGIQNQGTGAGQIGVSGSDVTYEGVVIGTFMGGTAGADLVITLDSDATPTAVQALVRNLTYNNTNATNNIDQSDRTIRVTVNDGDGGTSSNADITVDVVETVAPTVVSIVVDETALAVGETSNVTITFSEAVTGLTTGDFTVANGTLSSLSSADGGITWTATLTPDASVEDSSNLITLDNTAYTDIAGNAGTGTSDSNNYAIDTLRPTASIVVSDTSLTAGETSTVTITFNEAVSGLTTADLTVDNGTLSGLSSSDGGTTWTATLTPDTNTEDASNLITLDNTGLTDGAGNAGSGTTDSNSYAMDTLRPTASIVVSDTSLAAGETTTVTITFSEAVTGLTTADLTVQNGTLSGLSSSDGGITWTATLTPDANTEDTSNLITLDNTGYVDAAGNSGTGTTDSNNYDIDNHVPVNNLPSGQITDAVTQLVFSSGNGNAITVTDGGSLTVVISIGSGSLTATTGGTAGITNNGTGTVTITGTAAEVNAALEGLTFTPNGAGSLTLAIQTTDALGNVDSDNLSVTVNTATLLVTSNLDTGDDETFAGSFAADQADGGGLSMREALHWARAGDTITFDLDAGTAGNQGGSITLNGNQLQINYSTIKLDGDLNDDGAADVTISANNASRVMAISNSLSGVEITGLTLTQGSTAGGGGALQIGSSSSVTVRDSNFTNSTDAGLGGGGVYGAGATLTMINSTVSGNTSNTFGGGIRIVGSGGTLNLLNSTVSGNTTTGASAHGGGIQYGGTGGLTIINSTISGNATTGASSLGGGLRITSGTAFVYNSTIVGNASTAAGGGVHANGNDTFVNTVVAGNTSGAGATAGASGSPLATGGTADDVGATIETATNSYFGSNVAITTNNSSLNNQGTSNLLLGNLANYNGSAIQTHRPQTGSALLEAGSNAALPVDTYDLDGDSNTTETLPVDANGDQRVSNIVDIGAVEGNAVPVLTGVDGGGTFVENTGAVVIDGDATVSDNDLDLLDSGNGDYDGASLVIVRNGGAVATDNFGFNDGNGISLSGSNLVKAGQTIASFDTSTAGQLTITFTNANGEIPTRANVDAILQQITYSSSSEDPGTSVNLDITLNDGAGANVTETASLTILEVNDAPDVSATGGTPTFTENGSAVDLFNGVTIDTIESGQTITELTLTVTNLADGSNEILGADGTSIALTNGNSGTTANNSLSYSVSVTGSTATITLSIGGGISGSTAATIVDGLTYSNTSENPDTTTRTVTLASVVDSGGTSNSGVDTTTPAISATVSISAINDAPVVSSSPTSIAVNEDAFSAVSGIVFSDADSGSASVTVTLSVPSGALTATTGSGVTVGGTSSDLTLTGTVTDINAFIAASEIIFTPASNSSADVTLSVTIDDNGNSGTGGSLTDSTTVTLDVWPVNDAPVNSLPSTQNVDQDSTLTFNSGNGNLISISDIDAGSNDIEVTLTATNGVINLSGITGLIFSVGSGTGDATMTFSGSISDINAALDGLVFTPTAGYNGAASLEIVTNDQGWTGTGGAQSDTDTITITVDPLNPEITTVASTTADGTYKVGDVITFTITFDQTVIVDTAGGSPTLLLETGASDRNATYVGGSGTNTLTFSYTVQAGDESADLDYQSTGAMTLNGSTIESGAGNSAILTLPATGGVDSIAGQHDLVIDGTIPTASISVVDTSLNIGETTTVTITFNEAVSGLTTADFSVANGSLSGLSSGDGGITWTATLTPTSSIEDATNIITLDNTGLVDTAGNAGSGTTDSNNYAIDTLRPTASIVVSDTALAAGETTTVTITFNEAVTGLTTADFSVANGALSGLSSSDGGITWTATLTPTSSVEDATNLITLDNTGLIDAAGNTGTGTTNSNNYAVDTDRPVVNIALSDYALIAGETATVTFTFSETVTGFSNADITVSNGTLSTVTSGDGGITWTATFTPDVDTQVNSNLISIDNTSYIDAAGNTGTGSTGSINFTIDTWRPEASISVTQSTLAIGETTTVTIVFNEAITGLTVDDFVVENGSLSGLVSTDGGISWTATLTPTTNIQDIGNIISLDTSNVIDAAGNIGNRIADSNPYAIDTLAPTVSSVSVPVSVHYNAGDVLSFTVNTSETITVDTTGGTPRLALDVGGTTVYATYVAGSGTNTLVFQYTVQAGHNDANGINVTSLETNSGTLRDAAGNNLNITLNSIGNTSNVIVDTVAPTTSSIVVADTALIAGETSTVTITFNEAVTGIDVSDFTVANGTLSGLTSTDGGITWTATLTPTASITDTTNIITLNNTGVTDIAGNAGIGTTDSNNYAIDTLVPVIGSVSVPVGVHYNAGDTLSFTVNTTEVITVNTAGGAPRLALDVGGTIVYATYAAGSGTNTLVFQYTVQAGHNDLNGISVSALENNGATLRDAAGNNLNVALNNVGATNNVIVDTIAPTASIVVNDAALAAGETSTVTITFNEAITGLEISDFTVANGVLSGLSSSDGGITWTATLTPTANITDATNVITLNNTGVADIAGNSGTSTTDSNNYAIDATRPTATILVTDTALTVGETSTVTITFSEAVVGLTVNDFTVANGVLSGLSSSDGGIIWTATLTPNVNINDTTNVIVLNNTGVSDIAGNTGTGSTSSNNYEVSTSLPSNIPLFNSPGASSVTPTALLPLPSIGTTAPLIVLAPISSSAASTVGVLTGVESPSLITVTSPIITSPGMIITPPGLGSFSPVGLSTLSPITLPTLGEAPAGEQGSSGTGGGGRIQVDNASPINSINVANFNSGSSAFIDRGAMTSDISLQATPNMGQFSVQPGEAIYIAIPEGTFSANPNTQLTVEVRQHNGTPLPSWLVFDPVTGTISGEAPDNFKGKLEIEIVVRDNKGNSAISVMTLSVGEQPLSLYDLLHNSNQIALEQTGKPALDNQFARYGEVAREMEANALMRQLNTLQSAKTGT